MGFYTSIIFNNIVIRHECLQPMRDDARKRMSDDSEVWPQLFENLFLESDDGEVIDFQLSKTLKKSLAKRYSKVLSLDYAVKHLDSWESADSDSPPSFSLAWFPLEQGDMGKWYRMEEFANWLGQYCESGQLFQYTEEMGGGLWGWQFNNGKIRDLVLVSKGRFRKVAPS